MRKIKKPTFDALLKIIAMLVLFCASLFGIVFGALSITQQASPGPAYAGTVSVKVYFSPYTDRQNPDQTRNLDFAAKRDTNNTQAMTDAQIQQMLLDASAVYANRMSAQGFAQVATTINPHDQAATTDPTLTGVMDDGQSWLLNGGLPSLTVTLNKPNPQNANSDSFYDYTVMRQAMFAAGRDYGLTLETTDGYVVFASTANVDQQIRTVNNSAIATTPAAGTSTSTVHIDLRTPTTWNTADGQTALTTIENAIKAAGGTASDYFTGNGRASVEGAGKLFTASGQTSSAGNHNLVLWSDKVGALLYARWLFNATASSQNGLDENAALTNDERAFGDFLHKRGSYATGENTLTSAFTSASDITLKNLYYLIATPTAYVVDSTTDNTAAATQSARVTLHATEPAPTTGNGNETGTGGSTTDTTPTSNTVTTPDGTRKSLGIGSSFTGLFSPYILYEVRTTDSKAAGTPSTMLMSMFPANTQITRGGNTLLTLSQAPNNTGAYTNYTYAQATSVAQLIRRGEFSSTTGIVGVSATTNNQLLNNTFSLDNSPNTTTGLSAFGSSILALGVFLMAVGIIVSVLYRIPGLFAFIPLLLSGTIALLLYATFGQTVDLFGFGALFAIFAGGAGCLVYIVETFRRHVRNSVSYAEAFRLAFKHTFMKVVDVHLMYLVLGLFLTYLGQYQESAYGIILIVGTFVSFFLLYGSWVLYVKLFLALKNWTDHKLFVFKRDAKWQGQITGQLDASDRAALNAGTLSADNELAGLLKQTHKFNYSSRAALIGISVLSVILVTAGISSLVLNNTGTAWALSASTINASTNILWALFGVVLISAGYLALRYRWQVLAPYLIGSLLNFFACLTALLCLAPVWYEPAQFEAVATILGAFILGQTLIMLLIGWFATYYSANAAYGIAALNKLINNNIASASVLVVLNSSWYVLGYFVFALLNMGGTTFFDPLTMNMFVFNLFGLSLIAAVLCALSVYYAFTISLGCFWQLRHKLMVRAAASIRTPHAQVNQDPYDEQEIAGINSRVAAPLIPKRG